MKIVGWGIGMEKTENESDGGVWRVTGSRGGDEIGMGEVICLWFDQSRGDTFNIKT